ncbi:GDT1-like protein 1, chloroplastic isoform X2 [Aristolochia californica]|uniref:GDT1-like protein 1, chloroplastic isoform X2 n=1 Tax=Aristolochia californica TaxID=171875 RepID=UPI0035DFB5D7
MNTRTLCEGVLSPHLQPSSSISSKYSMSFSSFRLSPLKLKPPRQNSRYTFSRYSRQWSPGQNFGEESLKQFSETSPDYVSAAEEKCPSIKPSTANSDARRSIAQISMVDNEDIPKSFELDKNAVSYSLVHSWIKWALLFDLLGFQGSHQALASGMQSVAGVDFSSGIQSYLGDLGDISTGFASAFLLIFFSELGDKTFFIAALLAARNSGAIIFTGTFGALAAMTIVSVFLGRTFHYVDEILPFRFGDSDLPVDDIAAVFLLIYFGVSTLLEASSNDGLKAEEEQKEAELAVSEFSGNGAGIIAAANTVISTFLLVFVAEWGDKSFFSTIALAAAASPLGVIAGALAGHAAATLLAVLGGSLLGSFLSEKAIAYIGGTLFLVFAAATLIEVVR